MKTHLQYVEPVRSAAGTWKHSIYDGVKEFAAHRRILKEVGQRIAKAKVMDAPLDPIKLAKFVMQFMNEVGDSRWADCVKPWGFSQRIMLADLMGPEWRAASYEAQAKFASHWQPVVWADESWWTDSPYSLVHFLHQSVENPANVAYADSPEKLKAGRYTSTKAGRYLTRFFGGDDGVLTETQIKYWAERQAARACPAELEFIASDDKAGWVKVYEDGPSSCMRGATSVEVYAHAKSVLRLAYLVQGDEIKARCIVREDKKQYIRCYPNTSSMEGQLWHTAMQKAIEDAGYTHGNFYGVHLDKVPYPGARDYENKFIMPYLDSGVGNRCDTCVEESGDGKTFIVGSDGIDAQQQDGYVDLDGQFECDECGTNMQEDDGYFVESEEITVCEACFSDRFVTAIGRRGHETTIRCDNAIEVGGTWYDLDYLSDNDIYQCDHSDGYYELGDLCSTSRGYIHVDHVTALDEPDSDGNDYAFDGDVVTTHDGRTIHEDDAVTETINGVDVVFHKDDDIEAYKAEQAEGEVA